MECEHPLAHDFLILTVFNVWVLQEHYLPNEWSLVLISSHCFDPSHLWWVKHYLLSFSLDVILELPFFESLFIPTSSCIDYDAESVCFVLNVVIFPCEFITFIVIWVLIIVIVLLLIFFSSSLQQPFWDLLYSVIENSFLCLIACLNILLEDFLEVLCKLPMHFKVNESVTEFSVTVSHLQEVLGFL